MGRHKIALPTQAIRIEEPIYQKMLDNQIPNLTYYVSRAVQEKIEKDFNKKEIN